MPTMFQAALPNRARFRRVRAFTLIELLTVILIVAVLLGLLLPVLSVAQSSAKKTSTQALMRDVTTACDNFLAQERRPPGRFTARELGHEDNRDVGFTTMENALIDLTMKKAPKAAATEPTPENSYLDVGPYPDMDTKLERIDLSTAGSADGPGYLSLKSDNLSPVPGQITDPAEITDESGVVQKGMPDVLDAFGQPLMMWVADGGASASSIRMPDQFAALEYSEANPPSERPLFYWNANAGYLNATKLGQGEANQFAQSRLGRDLVDTEEDRVIANLTATLGSPSFPVNGNLSMPSLPRGRIVILSAGPDRVFFKRKPFVDASSEVAGKAIGYGPRRVVPGPDDMGEPAPPPDDAVFDDMILSTGT